MVDYDLVAGAEINVLSVIKAHWLLLCLLGKIRVKHKPIYIVYDSLLIIYNNIQFMFVFYLRW